MALVLTDNRSDIEQAALTMREGGIVVFPTETVYGIGANSMNNDAIDQIFKFKNRAENNPLVLHINNVQMADILIDISPTERAIFEVLVKSFWPGPVTFLLKKSKYVSDKCTAGSDYVGITCPQNKVTRDLISTTGVPICASSANISGKLSSSTFQHALNYFKDNRKITILKTETPCLHGVESTIIKIDNNVVSIIRPGIVTEEEVVGALGNMDVQFEESGLFTKSDHLVNSLYQTDKNVVLANFMADDSLNKSLSKFNIMKSIDYYLMTSVFIDFGGLNVKMMDKFHGYVDLSESGDPKEALFNMYSVLHQLIDIDCSNIIIFNFYKNKPGHYKTLYDRLSRCCNGKEVIIPYIVEEGSMSGL